MQSVFHHTDRRRTPDVLRAYLLRSVALSDSHRHLQEATCKSEALCPDFRKVSIVNQVFHSIIPLKAHLKNGYREGK